MFRFSEREPVEQNLKTTPGDITQSEPYFTLADGPLNMHRTASNEAKLKYAKQYLQKRQI